MKDNFELKFTGKASLVVELEGYTPMSISFNDKDLLMSVTKLLLDGIKDDGTTIIATTDAMVEHYNKIIGEIE